MLHAELLTVYDREVRGSFPDRLPPGWSAEQDGPLTRCVTGRAGFAMLTEHPARLAPAGLEGLVDRTFTFYADRDLGFEWKTFDHDPSGLRALLSARGARPEAREALVLGEAAAVADEARLPAGLVVRSVTDRTDLERVAALESEVWGVDWSWLAEDLAARLTGPAPAEVLLVEDGDRPVSAAWLVPLAGTRVAGLWGGGTLLAYRRRGVYRALVARRARRALDRGYPVLQVDASEDSRPVLERLGLHAVGGTVPFVAPAPGRLLREQRRLSR